MRPPHPSSVSPFRDGNTDSIGDELSVVMIRSRGNKDADLDAGWRDLGQISQLSCRHGNRGHIPLGSVLLVFFRTIASIRIVTSLVWKAEQPTITRYSSMLCHISRYT